MSFPTVAATNSGNSGADATSHVINMPAGVAVGDRLIVLFTNDNDVSVTVSSGTGWTELFTGTVSLTLRYTGYWKDATGSGDNLTIDTGTAQGSAHASYRITGHDPATSPEAAALGAGVDTNPNPPDFNPTAWDAEDTLWIACYGWDGNTSHTSYPANYTSNQVTDRWANAAGVGVAVSTRNLNAASENPGTATISASVVWIATTVAIRPSPPPTTVAWLVA